MSGGEFELSELSLGTQLGGGGAAEIWRCTTPSGEQALFKKYIGDAAAEVDPSVLRRLIAHPAHLQEDDRNRLFRICSWPTAIVIDNFTVAGIVIPEAAPRFYLTKGAARKPRELTYIARTQAKADRFKDEHFPSPHKLARLGTLLVQIDFLHSLGIVVGDLQPKNILTTGLAPNGAGRYLIDTYLIDCDSFLIADKMAFPMMDPVAWRVPYDARAFSAVTDLSKFAIIATRILLEDFSANNVPVSIFAEMAPMSELALMDRMRSDPNHGITSRQLKILANAWQSVVSPTSGRVYRRTDTILRQPWIPAHDLLPVAHGARPIARQDVRPAALASTPQPPAPKRPQALVASVYIGALLLLVIVVIVIATLA